MIYDYGYCLDSATCGEITRLQNIGYFGEIRPLVYGYKVDLHTKGYGTIIQKNCGTIYELIDFVKSIKSENSAEKLTEGSIGDIAAEKHRADVAEEALILACGDLSAYYYMTGAEALAENYIHQATKRLEEKQ